jgi:hypothetical protein
VVVRSTLWSANGQLSGRESGGVCLRHSGSASSQAQAG